MARSFNNLEVENQEHISELAVTKDSMNSISSSFEKIDHEEIDKPLQALELLLNKAKTPQCKNSLEQLKLFLSNADNASFNSSISEIYKNLMESLDKESDLDNVALYEVLGLDKKQAELDYASDLADLIKGQIAGFDEEKLRKMCIFSKISYGDVDRKLEKGKYKTKRQFEEAGYKIIKFYDNELIEDKYCSDTDYKLEQHDVGYALTGSNSYNRDAGYIFIKGQEVNVAYHGTRDLNDVREDLRASLTKLSFLSGDNYAHSGFYSLFKSSWPSIHKILQGHANDQGLKIKDLKINVTGHSMGGALASIAALCLNKTENAKDVHVATFGSPRVFYNGAAKIYNDCLRKKTIRVACQSDPLPCFPHGNGGMHYKHVGKPLKLETGKTLEYLEPYYHKIDTYYNLIQKVQQENFKSDTNASKYYYIAYACGLLYNAVLSYAGVDDKEFFKKVEEENKDIKLSEIPIEYAPKLEEKFKQGEQEVAQLTDEKVQLEKRLNSIQQSLVGKTKELDDEKGKSTQEQQRIRELNDQVTKLTKDFDLVLNEKTQVLGNTQAQLAKKEEELDEQISKVTKLNDTIEKLKETNAESERRKSNLTNQLEKLKAINANLEKNVDNLNNQFTEEKKALKDLKVRSEQNKSELKRKIEELNSTKQSQASRIVGLTAEIKELKKAKTELEKKVEFEEKALVNAQAQLKEREGKLDVAEKNASQLKEKLKQVQQSFAAKTKEFENAKIQLEKLQKGLGEKTSEAAQLRKVKAQFEQENLHLASQVRELEGKYEQTEIQLAESKQNLAKETSKVTQLSKEFSKTKAQLKEKKKEIGELNDQVAQLTAQNNQLNNAWQDLTNEITQLKNENNDLKTKLHEPKNKSKGLEKNLQKQSESKNEELNEKFLEASIYSKKQGNYASVSFVLSGAFAVGASLTMLHLAICISLSVAALTFLAVGCYYSYQANTALSNIEIENGSCKIAA